jgi:hypothetical protein
MGDPARDSAPKRGHVESNSSPDGAPQGMPAPKPGMGNVQRDQLMAGVEINLAEEQAKLARRLRANTVADTMQTELQSYVGLLDEHYDALGESRVTWNRHLRRVSGDFSKGHGRHASVCRAQGSLETALAQGLAVFGGAMLTGLFSLTKSFVSNSAKASGSSALVQALLSAGMDVSKDLTGVVVKDHLKRPADPTKPVPAAALEDQLISTPVADVDASWLMVAQEIRRSRVICKQAAPKLQPQVLAVLEAAEASGANPATWEEGLAPLKAAIKQAGERLIALASLCALHPLREEPPPYDPGSFRQYVEVAFWWEWAPSLEREFSGRTPGGLHVAKYKKPKGRGLRKGPVESRLSQLGLIAEAFGQEARSFGLFTSQEDLQRFVSYAKTKQGKHASYF